MSRFFNVLLLVGVGLAYSAAGATDATAQVPDPMVRALMQEDGPTYVYHTDLFAVGYGYHVYRQYEGQPEERLTAAPIYPPSSGGAFAQALSDEAYQVFYDALLNKDRAERTGQAPVDTVGLDPFEVFILTRADLLVNRFASFLYPEVAQAFGRLYIDRTAVPGVPITYRFAEVDLMGGETGDGISGTVTLQPQAPMPPEPLAVGGRDRQLDLQWSYPVPASDDDDDGVLYFDVYRLPTATLSDPTQVPEGAVKLNERPVLRNLATTEVRYFSQAPLDVNPIHLVVYAVDITGQRTAGEVVTYSVPDSSPPMPLTDVRTAVDAPARTVTVTWPMAPELDVAGYYVYRATHVDSVTAADRLTPTLLDPLDLIYTDTGLPAEGARAFYYRVAAVDTAGNESMPSAAAAALVEDHNPPAMPANLTADFEPADEATVEGGVVALTWDPVAAPDLQTYIIERRQVGVRSGIRSNIEDWTEAHYRDSGPRGGYPEGTQHEFRVSAMDSTRNIGAGMTVLVEIPNLSPPAVPEGLTAAPERDGTVRLFWQPVHDTDLATYALYRSVEGAAPVLVQRVVGDRQRHIDVDVAQGITYAYTLTAIDEVGNESDPSAPAVVVLRDYEGPAAVQNVQAVARAEGVTVTWEPVGDADLAGYRVYVAPIINGTYEPLHEALLAEMHFLDTSGAVGQYYRVVAVDTSGNESLASSSDQAVAEER